MLGAPEEEGWEATFKYRGSNMHRYRGGKENATLQPAEYGSSREQS